MAQYVQVFTLQRKWHEMYKRSDCAGNGARRRLQLFSLCRKWQCLLSGVIKAVPAFYLNCLWPYDHLHGPVAWRPPRERQFVCWLVACLTSQQQASVSQGRICSDNFTCCNTEIEVADQTLYLTQSQYADTGPTSNSADPITPGAWQGSHWSATLSHWYDSTPKKSRRKRDSNPGPSALEADALTTRPTRR